MTTPAPEAAGTRARDGRAYRLAVASRVLAALPGGYLLSSLLTALLGYLLPGPRAEAVLTATMLSFACYAVIVLWIFSVRSATQAWRGLVLAIGAVGLALLIAQRSMT